MSEVSQEMPSDQPANAADAGSNPNAPAPATVIPPPESSPPTPPEEAPPAMPPPNPPLPPTGIAATDEPADPVPTQAAADPNKARGDLLRAEIAKLEAEFETIKAALHRVVGRAEANINVHGYASDAIASTHHRLAEVRDWIARHVGP